MPIASGADRTAVVIDDTRSVTASGSSADRILAAAAFTTSAMAMSSGTVPNQGRSGTVPTVTRRDRPAIDYAPRMVCVQVTCSESPACFEPMPDSSARLIVLAAELVALARASVTRTTSVIGEALVAFPAA